MIAISEIHLSFHQQFVIDGYRIERCDRPGANSHGGFCLYIRDNIKTKTLACTTDSSSYGTVEYLFLELVLGNVNIFVGVLYNPPCVTLSSIDHIHNLLAQHCLLYDDVIVTGDSNIDLLKHTNLSNHSINLLSPLS